MLSFRFRLSICLQTSTSFYNERQKVQVSLAKAIEKDKTFGIGDNGEIKNISFGLYAAEDIVSATQATLAEPKHTLSEALLSTDTVFRHIKNDGCSFE